MVLIKVLIAAQFLALATAHATLQEVFVNNVSAGLYNCVRKPANKYSSLQIQTNCIAAH